MAGRLAGWRRFADSNGYQNDFARNMSPWRDWVIAAFNHHMPYDQFVTEQIAGDLLPNADARAANRYGVQPQSPHGDRSGSIEDEWFVENVVDRVETMGTVCLALRLAVRAVTITNSIRSAQREFYQLFAFFARTMRRAFTPKLVATYRRS